MRRTICRKRFLPSPFLGGVLGLVLAFAPASAAPAATAVLTTGLPNHALTPGVRNPAVTQATIHRTICVSGWAASIRPSTSYTTPLKVRQLVAYGFRDRDVGHYEEDHLISLELGGSPRDPRNLWPEPHHILLKNGTDIGSFSKDKLEGLLKRQVCAGAITLAKAQVEEAANWVRYTPARYLR